MIHELDSPASDQPTGPPLAPPNGPPTLGQGADPTVQVPVMVPDPSRLSTGHAALSDVELLKASRHDATAFRAFYDRWSEPVLAYFQRRVNDPQVALDLTAETFATVFEKRGTFRWKGSSPGSWVFGIAKNLLRRYFRTQAIQRRAVDRLGVQLPSYDDLSLRRVEELVDNAEMRRLVHAALVDCKEGDRRVLELRFIDGLPFSEVAQELNCSIDTARVRCHRALSRLEKHLAAQQRPNSGSEGVSS